MSNSRKTCTGQHIACKFLIHDTKQHKENDAVTKHETPPLTIFTYN